jgi:hypothetical protein
MIRIYLDANTSEALADVFKGVKASKLSEPKKLACRMLR